MSPPHLTADAPVLNVLQPLRVNLFPMRGKETNEMITHDCERFLCFRVTQEPLLTESRLDGHVAAIAEPDVVFVWLGFREQVPSPAIVPPPFLRASKRSSPSSSGTAGQLISAVRMQNIDDRQVMTLADFKIELVVRRRHLQNARAELRIDRFVGDDWNFLPRERTPDMFANQSRAYRLSFG